MNKVHIDNLRNTHLGILLEGVDLKNSIKSNNKEISDLKNDNSVLAINIKSIQDIVKSEKEKSGGLEKKLVAINGELAIAQTEIDSNNSELKKLKKEIDQLKDLPETNEGK